MGPLTFSINVTLDGCVDHQVEAADEKKQELSRRADPHLRGPHSRYRPDYQRRGTATAVYRWALGIGLCLISGPRHSRGAHALWSLERLMRSTGAT